MLSQASRIGPGVIPTGLKVVAHDQLSPEDKAKRLAAYAAVDEHVKDHHKVLGIGCVYCAGRAGLGSARISCICFPLRMGADPA